jgi:hypothetical protein
MNNLHHFDPLEGGFGFGDAPLANFFQINATESFGTLSTTFIENGFGDYFAIAFTGFPLIRLDVNYVSNDLLSFENFISDQSFVSLGITPSNVLITAGMNEIRLSFEPQFNQVSVPSTILMFGSAFMGLLLLRRAKA